MAHACFKASLDVVREIRRREPDQDLLGARVNVAHEANLAVPFSSIFLVDADRVDPERLPGKVFAEVLQGRVEVPGDVKFRAVAPDRKSVVWVAPQVGERFVLARSQGRDSEAPKPVLHRQEADERRPCLGVWGQAQVIVRGAGGHNRFGSHGVDGLQTFLNE